MLLKLKSEIEANALGPPEHIRASLEFNYAPVGILVEHVYVTWQKHAVNQLQEIHLNCRT